MNRIEAAIILEDVLDVLTEVGNGTTDKELHQALVELFKFRDEWFNGERTMKEAEPPARPKPDTSPPPMRPMPKFTLRERNPEMRSSPVDVLDDRGNVLHEDVPYTVGRKIIRALERYCELQ
ncbi:MAG: hypothetical protein Q8K86_11585 [Candidatus Nanopelagicaceae bacterium]|nr:hypothetical protein [Candidatus Nanopelagicaceae bacterium]